MPSALRDALSWLGTGGDLSTDQSRSAVAEIIDGMADPAEIAAFLTALRVKGETCDELAGAVSAARERMIRLDVPSSLRPILDTCGTGGDGANTVNVSTAAAIVVAACGVRVAKHGNRSASGNSGSAEVLAELGVKIDADHRVLIHCLKEVGITFLFAPAFHPALRHAAPVRRLLPFRTMLNLVGPLANPAWPNLQLLGTSDATRSGLIARTICRLRGADPDDPDSIWRTPAAIELAKNAHRTGCPGPSRSYVVSGYDGLDEVTLCGPTAVDPVLGWFGGIGERTPRTWEPSDFGLPTVHAAELVVAGPSDSATKIRAMLAGEIGPVRHVVLANAAAALRLAEKAATLSEGVAIAAEAIDRGDSARLLDRWATLSHSGG